MQNKLHSYPNDPIEVETLPRRRARGRREHFSLCNVSTGSAQGFKDLHDREFYEAIISNDARV